MTVLRLIFCLGLILGCCMRPDIDAAQEDPGQVRVKIETELGDIEVDIDSKNPRPEDVALPSPPKGGVGRLRQTSLFFPQY